MISLGTRWQSGLHHPVSVYAKQVTQGRLREQCCKYEILACQRHLDDLKRQGTEGFPWVFDATRADRIIRWFGQCIQVRGVDAGKPIVSEPWQVFDLGCTYGWVHKDTGARRFTHTYNKRARGNYKSSEKSCQGLYHMCGDACYPPYRPELARFELEPEVECAAVDRGQAMRVLGDAKKIALKSPNIAKRLLVPRSNPIVHRTRGGYMRALSKDTKNKDSGAPCYFVVDEYHAHPTSEIYDLGTNSFGKRLQSLLDVITTAGDDAGNKPCYTEELYAKRVLEDPAVTDESYFVMIRELDEGDNPHNEANWYKPNPCLRYPSQYSEILLKQIRDEYNAAYTCSSAANAMRWISADETDVSKSVFGGIQMYWAAEGATVAASKPQFRELKMDLEKMMGFLYCTDEMLSDSAFMSSFAGPSFALAADRLLTESSISGDGVGKPLGLLRSKALIEVAKESGQEAGTFVGANAIKMQARAMPRGRERLVWLMHPDLEEQLPYLSIQSGEAAKFLWNPEGGLGNFDTQRVLNKPVLFEDSCASPGVRGDALLVDPYMYILLTKGTVKQDWSIHVEFLTDQNCFRVVYRCNGAPKVNKPLTIKNSSKARSPFVALADRK